MALRVRIHPSHAATLAGIDYQDLRDVLVAAELNCQESIKKSRNSKGKPRKGMTERLAFETNLLAVTQALRAALDTGINVANGRPDGYGTEHLLPSEMTVSERRERLAEAKVERDLFDGIFAAMKKHAEEKKVATV